MRPCYSGVLRKGPSKDGGIVGSLRPPSLPDRGIKQFESCLHKRDPSPLKNHKCFSKRKSQLVQGIHCPWAPRPSLSKSSSSKCYFGIQRRKCLNKYTEPLPFAGACHRLAIVCQAVTGYPANGCKTRLEKTSHRPAVQLSEALDA